MVAINPSAHTALPKVIVTAERITTAEQFDKILARVPARYRLIVLVAIETGLRVPRPQGSGPADRPRDHHEIDTRVRELLTRLQPPLAAG